MRILQFALIGMMMLMAACSGKNDDQTRIDADRLYKESIRTLRLYTDSMRHATDSATVERLNADFDHTMTQLYYTFPPETDMSIPEGRNDTLATMTFRFTAMRDSLLYRFAHPLAAADTLPADSVSAATTDISQR